MGKKLNPSSMKISKQDERKQLNSLIKVLRPKVYITDSSSFKKLVQELTGFHEKTGPILPPLNHVESPPVMEIRDDGLFQESGLELSLDSGSNLLMKNQEFSEYGEIESWLSEIDQFQNYDTYAPLGVYDYDLLGLL